MFRVWGCAPSTTHIKRAVDNNSWVYLMLKESRLLEYCQNSQKLTHTHMLVLIPGTSEVYP